MAVGQIQRRYSRFMLDAFSYCRNPKIGAHIQQSVISRTQLHTSSCNCKPSTNKSAALQKRFYREYKYKNEGWFENPKRVDLTIILFSLGAVVAVSSGKWVTVPYTERNHFIFFGKFLRKMLPNEFMVEETVLPRLDPDSILARQIFQDIIDQALPLEMEIRRAENQETEKGGIMIMGLGGLMDDYEEEEPKCEIVVVDSAKVSAACFGRFGKIYVTNELLHYYTDYDEMIATIFGREVGHDLARHTEEKLSKLISTVSVIGTSLYLFWQSTFIRSIMPRYILVKLMRRRFLPSLSFVVTVALLSYFPMMKYNREIEMEADHIGLMLASSAGYNPIVGLMFPVHGVTLQTSKRWLPDCFYAFPSRGTRSLRLARPQVLTEAMYRNPRAKNPTN